MDKPPFSKSDIQLSEILAGLTDSVERGIDKVSRRQAMKGLYFGGLGLVAYSALKPSVTQNLSLASYRTAADIDESIPSLDELRLLANYEHSQLGAAPIEQVVSGQDLIEVDLPEALSPVLPTPDVKPETIAKLVLPPVPKVKPEAPVEPILPRIKPKLKFTVAVPKTAPSGKKPENKIFTASAPKLHIPSAGTRRLSVHAVNLNERETVTFAKNGRYDERGLRELNYIFRDRHTGSVRKMDPHLYDSLFELVSRAGDGQTEIKLISGYRTKKTNARLRRRSKGVAKNSYHITGQAVDFYLSNRSLKELHRNAVILDLGGVGYYPGANFVHMDTGPNRTWPRKYKYLVKRYRGYA